MKLRDSATWVIIGWVGFFVWLWPQLFFMENGELYAGSATVWADWAFHLEYAMRFFKYPASLWLADHPVFAGTQFNYPFLTSLFSGGLMRLGLSPAFSMVFPTMVWTAALILGLYFFFQAKCRTKVAAAAGVSLFVLGGGFAFVEYLVDGVGSGDALRFFTNVPAHFYAGPNSTGYFQFGGMLQTRLLPQRALQLGMALSVFVLFGIETIRRQKYPDLGLSILVALGFGLLPITHVHSFLCLSVILTFIGIRERRDWKKYWRLAALCAGFAGTVYILFHRKSLHGDFMALKWGWMAGPNSGRNFLWFWMLNWGAFLPLFLFSLRKKENRTDPYVWAGGFLFALANVIRFQPWDFDNTKIFVWSYLCLIPSVVNELSELWHRPKRLTRIFSVAAFVSLIFTGLIELRLIASTDLQRFLMFSKEDFQLAQKLQQVMKPGERVLTADRSHDWVAALAGGQVLLGYDGWVWSYGFPLKERQDELRLMFEGGRFTHPLLQKFRVRFVVLDRVAVEKYKANEKYFASHYPLLFEAYGSRVYDVQAR